MTTKIEDKADRIAVGSLYEPKEKAQKKDLRRVNQEWEEAKRR